MSNQNAQIQRNIHEMFSTPAFSVVPCILPELVDSEKLTVICQHTPDVRLIINTKNVSDARLRP